MRVLIACEESQAVCIAFRDIGHEAYSCDIQECSGGHPEWHIRGDCVEVIKMYPKNYFNIMILHPPCTYTALCGNRWYSGTDERQQGIDFCKDLWYLACDRCPKVALEQPKTIMQRHIGKKSQVIHPWMFGHMEMKETWLWLQKLPLLTETNNVYNEMMKLSKKEREKIFFMSPGINRGKLRSKTYKGIAAAMAEQWG